MGRLKNVWEGLLSKATLVGHYEGQNTFASRKDAFIRKGGLMPETQEVPWDIHMNGRSSGLHKRLQSQGSQTMAGKMFTPAPAPNSVQYVMGVQAFQLGLDPWSRCRPRKWKQKVQDATYAARTARLNELVTSGLQDGSARGDAAYMQSVTGSGQVWSWAKLVPAFGARVNFRRLRLGLLEGTAKVVARRVPGSTEAICKKVGTRALSAPPALGLSRQDPMWSWTAPNTSMYGQQPVLRLHLR